LSLSYKYHFLFFLKQLLVIPKLRTYHHVLGGIIFTERQTWPVGPAAGVAVLL
jgi:hypothetical protein